MTNYKITICSNVEHLTNGFELPEDDRDAVAMIAIDKALDLFSVAVEASILHPTLRSSIEVEYDSSWKQWNGGYYYRMNEYREKGWGNGFSLGCITLESDDSLEVLPTAMMKLVAQMSMAMQTVMLTEEVRRDA